MTWPVDTLAVAVVVVRDGRLPAGADEAVAEAGGTAVIVGAGAGSAAGDLVSAERIVVAPVDGTPAQLAAALAAGLAPATLVVLPGSPDGRDLAPRLASRLARPLLSGVVAAATDGTTVTADLLRVDGRVVVPASVPGPAVVTLWPGARDGAPAAAPAEIVAVDLDRPADPGAVVVAELVEPDPATMDLAEATRVMAGGAGLVPAGATDQQASAWFALLNDVAATLGTSAGATRVVTDAGWMGYDRQIGTTGVTLAPVLYVALGVSGASQHVGGIGDPVHTVSVNVDPSCPMTALADLGLVADAPGLLIELAARLDVAVPAGLEEAVVVSDR